MTKIRTIPVQVSQENAIAAMDWLYEKGELLGASLEEFYATRDGLRHSLNGYIPTFRFAEDERELAMMFKLIWGGQ
jgi:hypothetical protein